MSGKTLYDVLGVERNATAEQIRAAYLLRSKVLHPDRFDQNKQPTEWKLANELVKELNNAYSVLRNSLDRADYDRTLSGQSQSARTTSSQQQNTQRSQTSSPPPRPAPNVKLGKLQSGKTYFDLLPRSIQEQLKKRVAGTNKHQVSVKISGVGGNYFLGALFVGWYWFLLASASDSRWSSDGFWWLLAFTGLVAVLQGFNTDWILNWYRSPLRYRLFITPIYIIKTHWDEVSFWPLWEVTGMNATHKYTNGIYQGTDLTMSFKDQTENLKISPPEAYDRMREAMRAFTQKIQTAREQQDWQYFFDQDDFREFDSDKISTTRTRHVSQRTIVTFAASFLLSAILFGVAYGMNTRSPGSPVSTYTPPPTPTYSPPARQPNPFDVAEAQLKKKSQPAFSEPEQPTPEQGGMEYGDSYVNSTGTTAPLKITTRASDGNYVMKVVNWDTGEFVASYFINRGSTLSIELPLGSYKLKFASGDKWYGTKFLFGPRTSYSYIPDKMTFYLSGDYARGHRIELIPQVGGNLDTRPMSSVDW